MSALRNYSAWQERRLSRGETPDSWNTQPDGGVQARVSPQREIVFLHQDYVVTQEPFRGSPVVFDDVTAEWRQFCHERLAFRVPEL